MGATKKTPRRFHPTGQLPHISLRSWRIRRPKEREVVPYTYAGVQVLHVTGRGKAFSTGGDIAIVYGERERIATVEWITGRVTAREAEAAE